MTTPELEVLLQEFSEIIASKKVEIDKQEKGIQFFKARIILKDTSKLAFYEALAEGSRKYGYQWMQADNTLIICWDNADHHPEISTHPYHQHIGTRANVQPSEPMTLRKVLAYIAQLLAAVLVLWAATMYLSLMTESPKLFESLGL